MLMQLIQPAALVLIAAVLLYQWKENRRLRAQNTELLQLVADAAAQATIDHERQEELAQQLFRRKEGAL